MLYFVYILYSHKDGGLYVGCSIDTTERLRSHNNGYVQATKNRRPLELIHIEKFGDKGEAFQRERFLKSLWASRFKKNLVKKYRQNRV